MSCEIERNLQRMQADATGDHLPLEDILSVLHDEEFAQSPLLRGDDLPFVPIPRFMPRALRILREVSKPS